MTAAVVAAIGGMVAANRGYHANNPPTPRDPVDEHRRRYGESCATPALYLDNGRVCDGCEYFNVCQCRLKKLKKK